MRHALFALALIAIASPAHSAERRCGWVDNPTPANWWLTDRHGIWIIGTQGGAQAEGMDLLPEFPARQWVRTNGNYGYGCACMTVVTRGKGNSKQITRILAASIRPLSVCRADRALRRG